MSNFLAIATVTATSAHLTAAEGGRTRGHVTTLRPTTRPTHAGGRGSISTSIR